MAGNSVKDFVRVLGEVDHSKNNSEVFRDFCELFYCSLSKPMCADQKQAAEREKQYMAVISRYRDKENTKKFWLLRDLLLDGLEVGGVDYLGEVAGEIGALSSDLGQFFTPFPVCRLMAEISLSNVDEIIIKNGFITINEPASGSGANLLAAAEVLRKKNISFHTNAWIEATDINTTAFYMTYIQLGLSGFSGVIRHGNTLTQDFYKADYLPLTPLFFAIHGDPFAKENIAAEKLAQKQKNKSEMLELDRVKRLKNMSNSNSTEGAVQIGFDF